jgi:transposase
MCSASATHRRVGSTRRTTDALAGAVSTHGEAPGGTLLARRTETRSEAAWPQARALVWPAKSNPANERLAQHLWSHREEFFTFLAIPGVDATNWRAEHALRFAVVNRNVWGGNCTAVGGQAQGILLSVWRTAWQRLVPVIDAVSRALQCPGPVLALPP